MQPANYQLGKFLFKGNNTRKTSITAILATLSLTLNMYLCIYLNIYLFPGVFTVDFGHFQ